MKTQTTEWEKIFVNDMSYKWLISKTYKELIQLNVYIYIFLKNEPPG